MSSSEPIAADAVVTRNDDMVGVEVDGTVVMMSVEQGMYFGLNGVGPRIWSLLATPRTVGDLCRELQEEFEVEPELCRAQVLEFLAGLVEAGLVQVDREATAETRPAAGA